MKKALLCLVLSPLCATSLLDTASNKAADSLRHATQALSQYVQDICVNTHSYAYYNNNGGVTFATGYDYGSGNPKALEALKNHKNALANLESSLLVNAFGDGLLIGLLTGICTQVAHPETLSSDGRPLLFSTLGAIALILAQNHTAEPTPYYTIGLAPQENYFAMLSRSTFGRLIISAISAAAGCIGGRYIVNRATE